MMSMRINTVMLVISTSAIVGFGSADATEGLLPQDPPVAIHPILDTHCGPQTVGAEVGYKTELRTWNSLTWDEDYHAYGDFRSEGTETINGKTHWLYEIKAGFSWTADWCDDQGHNTEQRDASTPQEKIASAFDSIHDLDIPIFHSKQCETFSTILSPGFATKHRLDSVHIFGDIEFMHDNNHGKYGLVEYQGYLPTDDVYLYQPIAMLRACTA